MNSATIVQKLWNYCNVLRDDGMSYGDYIEQLTYPIKGVSDQSKGAATIIVCGRKNMSVTLWFTVLRNQTGRARIFQKYPSSLPFQRFLL